MVTYTLRVVEVRRETEDTVTICFKQPALRKIKYKAGQYLTLIFRINGRRYIRPYSFSSTPVVDDLLEITVKRVQNGIVSNHIHDVVRVGDSIEVMSPMGDFVYDRTVNDDQVFFWGTGSGITPLISIIKQILETIPMNVKVHLIYGNRNYEQTIFADVINSLLYKFPERFKVWHFHSQFAVQENSPFIIEGRITETWISDMMRSYNAASSVHYICGATGLKQSVKSVLAKIEVPVSQIFSEDFELLKDPADFNDITTREIKIRFGNETFDLEVTKGQSVLESALNAGIELPYSCQTGNCSTCKASLLSGALKMIGPGKDRNDLLQDEYLTCCSYPLTENIYLQV